MVFVAVMAGFCFVSAMQPLCRFRASRILASASLFSLLLLAGCGTPLTNVTPKEVTDNPSERYTISFKYAAPGKTVPGSLSVGIVIDGKPTQPMTLSAGSKDLYTYDFQATPGYTELKYYVLISYLAKDSKGVINRYNEYSPLQSTKILGRYVGALETDRGPVGARIGVAGSGFTAADSVSLGNMPAHTEFESDHSLAFYVPGVPVGRKYPVRISSQGGTVDAGTFTVDGSDITVSPSALNLRRGETQSLTFTVALPAGRGGRELDMQTDVKGTVIVPTIMIPAGGTKVTVAVTGGNAGSCTLFLAGSGGGEIRIPVTVSN